MILVSLRLSPQLNPNLSCSIYTYLKSNYSLYHYSLPYALEPYPIPTCLLCVQVWTTSWVSLHKWSEENVENLVYDFRRLSSLMILIDLIDHRNLRLINHCKRWNWEEKILVQFHKNIVSTFSCLILNRNVSRLLRYKLWRVIYGTLDPLFGLMQCETSN